MTDKPNPYAPHTPKWLLFENIKSYEASARAYHEDTQRFAEKAAAARKAMEEFQAALDRLNA